MKKEEIENKINNVLVDEFEIAEEDMEPDARLINDLGIESLDFVDIAVIIEKDFGFKVVKEEITKVKTLNDLYQYIEDRVKS